MVYVIVLWSDELGNYDIHSAFEYHSRLITVITALNPIPQRQESQRPYTLDH